MTPMLERMPAGLLGEGLPGGLPGVCPYFDL